MYDVDSGLKCVRNIGKDSGELSDIRYSVHTYRVEHEYPLYTLRKVVSAPRSTQCIVQTRLGAQYSLGRFPTRLGTDTGNA